MNNKGADQTALMRKLVCVFVVCNPLKTGFLAMRPKSSEPLARGVYKGYFTYILPLFDRPKTNIVFSNTLKVRSCIANQIYIQKFFFREKETKHRYCLECLFCFRFSTLLLFTYDWYKNKIHIQQILLNSSCSSCHIVC